MPDGFGNDGYINPPRVDTSNIEKRVSDLEASFAKHLRSQGKSLQYIAKTLNVKMRDVKEMLKE